MIHQRIKNLILIIMVIACVYLGSNVWLKIPDFLMYDFQQDDTAAEEVDPKINFWKVIKPIKNIINYKDNYTVLYSDDEYNLWLKATDIISNGFKDYNGRIDASSVVFPTQYLKFDFPVNIPIEIFTDQMKIENDKLNEDVGNIKNIIIDLDNRNCIYIYNGESTFKIESDKINSDSIFKTVEGIDFNNATKYSLEEKIGEEKIQIPVPLEQSARNPVFVQSELDVFDTAAINKIAKNYFKNNYEYVRKLVEVSGNLVYVYRTEKVLKINAEGQLDFYDSNLEFSNNHDIRKSLISAINFTENFLGFPKDGYLSNIESIQIEGNYGYRFIFSYNILDRPILFSRVRDNAALQIDVIGDDVVSYKRFIRNIDETQRDFMKDFEIMSAADVINKNLQSGETTDGIAELKPLKLEMIKNISNIYLGYFDLSRVQKEQVLRVVWVIEVGDKSYIFNAISGALIEEW
nr:two-component system activity regulator YycH [Sedimentibacter sp.]